MKLRAARYTERTVRRRLLNALTVLSLLLCAGMFALWMHEQLVLYEFASTFGGNVRIRDSYTTVGFASVTIPLPLALIITAALPVSRIVLMVTRLKRRRAKLRLCHRCGYDLRASPDRCPECGTFPPLLSSLAPSERRRLQRQESAERGGRFRALND